MARISVFRFFLSDLCYSSTACAQKSCRMGNVLFRTASTYMRCFSSSSANRSSEEDTSREERNLRKKRLVAVMIGSTVGLIGSSYALYRKLTKTANAEAMASSIAPNANTATEVNNEEGDDTTFRKGKKHKHGFRERRIIEYENRIRQYSTPDKVFRYFATLKVVHHGAELNEVYMTPEDFVRSLTPGKIQPEGLGLDEHERFNPEKHKYKGDLSVDLGQESIFLKMGEYGLISFSDYIFLLTVLSLPPRLFEIAFQMFDLNGDGEVSPEEFEKVQNTLFSMTPTGMRHRDHAVTGSVISGQVNSGLKEYFFGRNSKERLTSKRFIEFQKKLQKEVMYLEFMSYDPVDEKITEWEFADMLLTYSSFHEKKKQKILRKVKRAFKENSQGVTFKDYLDFFTFMRNILDADMALSFHHAAGKAIDPETLKQVAKTVADVQLRDNVVNVVYKMFDENDDGVLSHRELIVVIKNQLVRGLENPKDTGFGRLIEAVWRCGKRYTYGKFHRKTSDDMH